MIVKDEAAEFIKDFSIQNFQEYYSLVNQDKELTLCETFGYRIKK